MTDVSTLRVERALRKAAQLRALCRRLPHTPTPAEARLLAEFAELTAGGATTYSPASLRAGFRAAWASREYDTIVAIAEQLPADLIQTDPTLLLYYENARRLATAR